MTRVKGGTVSKNRRRKVLKSAKGYFGNKQKIYSFTTVFLPLFKASFAISTKFVKLFGSSIASSLSIFNTKSVFFLYLSI